MLRISDKEAIRNPVHYLYTVANNLVKEHAVLERRQASGVDIDEAPAQEQLQTLPEFDGELDARQRVARLAPQPFSDQAQSERFLMQRIIAPLASMLVWRGACPPIAFRRVSCCPLLAARASSPSSSL